MSFRGTRSSHLTIGALIGILAALVLAPIGAAFAHSNHDHKMYVAPSGRDVGACDQPWLPCRTIRYAIQQATGQGSAVRVAAGEYFFDAREVVLLVGNQIPVQGGYSLRDGYTTQSSLNNPTYIKGIPARYRQPLLERGFGRVEDRDRLEDSADITPGSPELVIPSELATPLARQDCVAGMAGIFPCRGMDFLGSVALSQFSGATDGSNLWGHVDLNTGREYAVIGVDTGTGVVDVTDPVNPVVIGTVPGINSIWREVKVYQFFNNAQNRWNAYAYISTEASAGLQIINLNNLSNASPSVSLANTMSSDFTTSHTVYVKNVDYALNTALPGKTATLYMNGTNKTSGIFRAFSLLNPATPALIGAPSANIGYTHDSTSMIITDSRTSQCASGHNPCEIMIDFNGSGNASSNRVKLWDITNPATPTLISSTPYTGSRYAHSGWYTADTMHMFIQDELDEGGLGHNTRVRTLDLSNLLVPTISAVWDGPTRAIDHNGYTIGNKYYMSNYRRGLTILDITNPNAISERAFLDTYPGSDSANYNGAWGVYPFLPSGNLLISDIERGLVIVRESDNTTINQAVSGLSLGSDSPTGLGATTAFTATIAAGTNVSYSWDFGDGTAVVTGTSTITHTYTSAATYTAQVTATNTVNSASTTTSVTVAGPDVAIAGLSLASDSPTTLGATTAFTATTGAGSNITYAWNFGDGSPVVNSASTITHTYASAATYTAQVTATNTVNSASSTTSVTVASAAVPFMRWLPFITAWVDGAPYTAQRQQQTLGVARLARTER